jgi:hypothetical protein
VEQLNPKMETYNSKDMVNTPGFQLRREQRRKQVEAELERLDQAILSPIVKMDKRFEQSIQEAHLNLEQLEK